MTRNERSSPERASTVSMSGRFDDDASPSGQRAANRSTASTAPGSSGSRSRYRASIRRTTSAEMSAGASAIPSSSCM